MPPKFQRGKWKVEDIALLEFIFLTNKYPDIEDLSSIAVITNKTRKQTKVWFQNARQRKK